jgi:hypothetical protein
MGVVWSLSSLPSLVEMHRLMHLPASDSMDSIGFLRERLWRLKTYSSKNAGM